MLMSQSGRNSSNPWLWWLPYLLAGQIPAVESFPPPHHVPACSPGHSPPARFALPAYSPPACSASPPTSVPAADCFLLPPHLLATQAFQLVAMQVLNLVAMQVQHLVATNVLYFPSAPPVRL